MNCRPFTSADRDGCLAIYDSNASEFFSLGDREEFAAFLAAPPGTFLVLCDARGTIVGCGGIAAARGDPRAAVLTWGMIHLEHHGRGWGKLLTQARLGHLAAMPEVAKVVMHTSQKTAGFYRKLGFREVFRRVDGYRPGLDRHDLEFDVTANPPGMV